MVVLRCCYQSAENRGITGPFPFALPASIQPMRLGARFACIHISLFDSDTLKAVWSGRSKSNRSIRPFGGGANRPIDDALASSYNGRERRVTNES